MGLRVTQSILIDGSPVIANSQTGYLIVCDPPSKMCKITNIYVDPKTQKVIVKYDDIPKE